MIFTSWVFFAFFALLLAALALLPRPRARVWVLLIGSYVFYGWWDWRFLFLIFAISAQSWLAGLLMASAPAPAGRRFWMWLSVALSLLCLGFFKYADFFIGSLDALFGIEGFSPLHILLPVGISFFTFQAMSYVIDLYRGEVALCRDLPEFLLFVAFFPQLVAGPIVRAAEFLPQLARPVELHRDNAIIGAQIFLGGMVLKALFADNLAQFADPVFAHPELWSPGTLWLGVAAYGGQIFCDFAGYSLMAIGAARILGFHLPDNFDMPYVARSAAEFWHRWHMTLSRWLRDYLYIPLGGSRHGKARTLLNLGVTMILGGLWHGASWNFVVWGLLHGAALVVHRLVARPAGGALWRLAGWALTLGFVLLAWVPFRCRNFEVTFVYLKGLAPHIGPGTILWPHVPTLLLLGLLVAWHGLYLRRPQLLAPAHDPSRWRPAILIGLALLALALFAPLGASPFIYFQF